MSYRRITCLVICLTLLTTACTSGQDTSTESSSEPTETSSAEGSTSEVATTEAAATVDDYLDSLETQGFEGSVIIQHEGETTSAGFGLADRENDVANTPDTIFDIGSVTKQFTAAGILRLEMDGVLSVDDPITDYVEGLPDGYDEVTLHHLLTHSSGVRDGDGRDYDEANLETFISELGPLETTPGDTFTYSNSGYSLLAAVIEQVTGDSYEVYMNEAIFTPAGMEQTGYLLPGWDQANVAIGYEGQTEFARPNELPWAEDGPYWYLRGNGGILSSVEDMMLWHEALNGESILDAEAKEKMYTQHIPTGDDVLISYGYGWGISPTETAGTLIAHNGGNGFFFADFVRFVDEDLAIFIASNNSQNIGGNEAFDLANIILETDEFVDTDEPEDTGVVCDVDTEEVASMSELDEFGDDPASQTMAEFLRLIAEGDEAELQEFAETSVAADSLPTDVFVEEAGFLQDGFGVFEVTQILQVDPQTFFVWIETEDADEIGIVGHLNDEEPPMFDCIDIIDE